LLLLQYYRSYIQSLFIDNTKQRSWRLLSLFKRRDADHTHISPDPGIQLLETWKYMLSTVYVTATIQCQAEL
jgi:hypothetical protein